MPEINIKEEAERYFTAHYPRASLQEIDKQVEDWEGKIKAGESLVSFFSERVGDIRGKKVLDVGFGSGGIITAFNRAGAISYGIDVDPELQDIAARNIAANGAAADLRVYDGVGDLPYESDYFDFATSFSVLEHVTGPEKLLDEVLRVLKPGGRFLLTLPNRIYPKETHSLAYFVSYLPRGLARVYLKLLKRSPLEDDNLHFYGYFSVLKMLRKSNFKYEVVYKDMTHVSGPKRFVICALKSLGIHYTAFLKQLIFVIEKK